MNNDMPPPVHCCSCHRASSLIENFYNVVGHMVVGLAKLVVKICFIAALSHILSIQKI
jgi:hypothetical protein